MHIHQSVYERISNSISDSIFVCISCSISDSIFVCISNSISCCIFRAHSQPSRCRHGCFAFACAGARSTFAARSLLRQFVARQRKRRQTAEFNQIRSARLNSGVQRQLVQARLGCALKCHGKLAILVGDRSRGNSGAATSK